MWINRFKTFRELVFVFKLMKRVVTQHISVDITKLNFVALARKRTIPTERPLLVGEVSAILFFLRIEVSRGQRSGSPRPLISIF
jgi:hypothetical protein